MTNREILDYSIYTPFENYLQSLEELKLLLRLTSDESNIPIMVYPESNWYTVGYNLILKDVILKFGTSGYREGISWFVCDAMAVVLLEKNNLEFK